MPDIAPDPIITALLAELHRLAAQLSPQDEPAPVFMP
jgi:hypothetical protein